jgi:hypothetical protein
MPRNRARRDVVRPQPDQRGTEEVLDVNVEQARALHVVASGQVEGDIDTADLIHDLVRVLLHGLFVERVERRHARPRTLGCNLISEGLQGGLRAADQEHRCPSRANVRATAEPMCPLPP